MEGHSEDGGIILVPQYITRTTQLAVVEDGKPLFDGSATIISIDDEAGGEFVRVRQVRGAQDMSIGIDPAEWPAIRDAVNQLIGECRNYE